MTPVELTHEAVAYVRQRGGALTLRRTPRHGCCGGTVEIPVAEAVAPPDATGFARCDLDGPGGPIALYVEAGLDVPADAPLRVGLDRLLGLRSLYVEGAAAQMSPRPAPPPPPLSHSLL